MSLLNLLFVLRIKNLTWDILWGNSLNDSTEWFPSKPLYKRVQKRPQCKIKDDNRGTQLEGTTIQR